ncbi:hypothetical protein ACIBO2_03020 [Nonomuraea sp. NPDC050022]|uniref:hypothetical protein n=1 Tax=unclassified Nonomuraea TaxID=2593643 RepID=UPI0033F503AA
MLNSSGTDSLHTLTSNARTSRMGNVTRYLCGAAYLDSGFRVRALIWLWAGYSAFSLLFLAIFSALFSAATGLLTSRRSSFPDIYGIEPAAPDLVSDSTGSLLQAPMVPAVTLGVALVYRIAIYLTLVGSLKPGAPEPIIRTPNWPAASTTFAARNGETSPCTRTRTPSSAPGPSSGTGPSPSNSTEGAAGRG